MAAYRGVVRHVRYWRGKVHKWSTSYTFTGSLTTPLDFTACNQLATADSRLCYHGPDTAGGIYQVQFYDLQAGGTAVATANYFDPLNPAAWLPYDGSGWGSNTLETDATAENALLVEWAGGFSKTGKPVTFKHWYHAVPAVEPVGGAQQVSAGDVASLTTAANRINGVVAGYGIVLGSKAGRLAGNATVSAYYGNHQMPRGRRKKRITAQQASNLQNFLNGVITQQAGKQAGS